MADIIAVAICQPDIIMRVDVLSIHIHHIGSPAQLTDSVLYMRGVSGQLGIAQLHGSMIAGMAVARRLIGGLLVDHLDTISNPAVISEGLDDPIQRRTSILLPARSPYLRMLHHIHRHRRRIDLRIRPTSHIFKKWSPAVVLHRIGLQPGEHFRMRNLIICNIPLPQTDQSFPKHEQAGKIGRVGRSN
jgi:hypothetical protein